jgi:hypothetical protein
LLCVKIPKVVFPLFLTWAKSQINLDLYQK